MGVCHDVFTNQGSNSSPGSIVCRWAFRPAPFLTDEKRDLPHNQKKKNAIIPSSFFCAVQYELLWVPVVRQYIVEIFWFLRTAR